MVNNLGDGITVFLRVGCHGQSVRTVSVVQESTLALSLKVAKTSEEACVSPLCGHCRFLTLITLFQNVLPVVSKDGGLVFGDQMSSYFQV